MQCSFCSGKAVFEARYNGTNLCREHFFQSVEKRFRQELREQIKFDGEKTRIAVAISGGKDSSVLLYLLHKTLSERHDVELESFTIDEGIEGYRSEGLKSAMELSRNLSINHRTMSFKESFGLEMDGIVKGGIEGTPCSRCGPMRRKLINEASLNIKADYVALGMNLDDYSQSVLMNVARGDLERTLRMAPHRKIDNLMIPRIVPLRRIYEKEIKLYAILREIPHDAGWCPYSEAAQRNKFRDILNELESVSPGTKFSVLNFSEALRTAIHNDQGLPVGKCSVCGGPTSESICQTCRLIEA
ncbi:MAG: TIGR00269 family protein [Candidatus Thermoplasmatota archaeon]|jgi:uncharacterized protein (TIGR00269 family)|nr:TIGR00269 family protein [Candidatus Thermoplasmatota archaeon]MCL5787034.1 TIGR00269 family protein [Candidatus Thermoplasmatota archaeon]